MIDFRIDTFLTVCKYNNYTQAARELNLTQPAVTQHIQYLERYYGQALFHYEKKKLSLTEAGKILYRVSTAMKNDEAVMIKEMNPVTEGHKEICFGATMTIGEYVLPKRLARYSKAHPDCNIRLMISNTDDLINRLTNQEISFAMIEGYYEHKDFESRILSVEPYIAVCGSNYLLKENVNYLKDLTGERLLLREEGSGTREILAHNLEAHGMGFEDFANQIEINSLPAILSLLKENVGISFMYQAAAIGEIKAGHLRQIPLVDFTVEHNFTCLWSKHSAYEALYDEICTELGKDDFTEI